METIITFRGRKITQDDIATIRKIIDRHPTKSRRFISQEVCRRWNWKQPNGSLKDMTCRSLLLLLETKGLIVQPPRKCQPANPLVQRKKPAKIVIDQSPLQGPLKNLFPIQVEQARKTPKESIFNRLIETHHYLGYTQTEKWGSGLSFWCFVFYKPADCWIVQAEVTWYFHLGVSVIQVGFLNGCVSFDLRGELFVTKKFV